MQEKKYKKTVFMYVDKMKKKCLNAKIDSWTKIAEVAGTLTKFGFLFL